MRKITKPHLLTRMNHHFTHWNHKLKPFLEIKKSTVITKLIAVLFFPPQFVFFYIFLTRLKLGGERERVCVCVFERETTTITKRWFEVHGGEERTAEDSKNRRSLKTEKAGKNGRKKNCVESDQPKNQQDKELFGWSTTEGWWRLADHCRVLQNPPPTFGSNHNKDERLKKFVLDWIFFFFCLLVFLSLSVSLPLCSSPPWPLLLSFCRQ